MLEWLKTTVGVSISGGVLLTVVGFILKNWFLERLKNSIKSEYDKDLETHKANLKRDYDVQIEKLRADAAKNNIKLTEVFEEQAETIAEVYSKLVTLISAMEDYTAVMTFESTPPLPERRKIVAARMKEFVDYYRGRKIYIPSKTQETIDAFFKKINTTTMRFMFDVEQHRQRPVEKDEDDTWLKTMNFMSKEVVEIMNELDSELKQILGLTEEEKVHQPK